MDPTLTLIIFKMLLTSLQLLMRPMKSCKNFLTTYSTRPWQPRGHIHPYFIFLPLLGRNT